MIQIEKKNTMRLRTVPGPNFFFVMKIILIYVDSLKDNLDATYKFLDEATSEESNDSGTDEESDNQIAVLSDPNFLCF